MRQPTLAALLAALVAEREAPDAPKDIEAAIDDLRARIRDENHEGGTDANGHDPRDFGPAELDAWPEGWMS